MDYVQVREEPPSYSSPNLQRFESFENPLATRGSQSFSSQDDQGPTSENPQSGKALYDFTAGGDDEVLLQLLDEQTSGLLQLHFEYVVHV